MEKILEVTPPPNDSDLTINGGRQIAFPFLHGLNLLRQRLTLGMPCDYAGHEEIGHSLKHCEQRLIYMQTDWIQSMRADLGNESAAEILRTVGFPSAEFEKTKLLASISVRDYELTPEHHYAIALAGLDETAQKMWVDLAKEHNLTPADLKESIKKGTPTKITKDPAKREPAGVTTWGAIRMEFETMQRRIGDDWKNWTIEEIDGVFAQIEPIVRFASNLQWHKRALIKMATAAPDITKAA